MLSFHSYLDVFTAFFVFLELLRFETSDIIFLANIGMTCIPFVPVSQHAVVQEICFYTGLDY